MLQNGIRKQETNIQNSFFFKIKFFMVKSASIIEPNCINNAPDFFFILIVSYPTEKVSYSFEKFNSLLTACRICRLYGYTNS